MGAVAVKYRLLPESVDADFDELMERIQKALPEGVKIQKVEKKPFAFGLSAMELLVIMRDEAGISDRTEASLSEIDGVQSIETLEMSLI